MTQCEKILKYIEDHGSITDLEAAYDLKIMRLSARIHDIKRMGILITDKWETNKREDGTSSTYKRYSKAV